MNAKDTNKNLNYYFVILSVAEGSYVYGRLMLWQDLSATTLRMISVLHLRFCVHLLRAFLHYSLRAVLTCIQSAHDILVRIKLFFYYINTTGTNQLRYSELIRTYSCDRSEVHIDTDSLPLPSSTLMLISSLFITACPFSSL